MLITITTINSALLTALQNFSQLSWEEFGQILAPASECLASLESQRQRRNLRAQASGVPLPALAVAQAALRVGQPTPTIAVPLAPIL